MTWFFYLNNLAKMFVYCIAIRSHFKMIIKNFSLAADGKRILIQQSRKNGHHFQDSDASFLQSTIREA